MKTIVMNVTCSYEVELTCEVDDDTYEELCDIHNNANGFVSGFPGAEAWMGEHIDKGRAEAC